MTREEFAAAWAEYEAAVAGAGGGGIMTLGIYIKHTIYSTSMGEGTDAEQQRMAERLADYTADTWRADLEPLGYELEIDISVIPKIYGYCPPTEVYAVGLDVEEAARLEARARAALTDDGEIWERFLERSGESGGGDK